MSKLILAVLALTTFSTGSFSPTGGAPLRISPNSAFRSVSRTGSTPVSSGSLSLARETPPHISDLPAIVQGASGVVVPEFGHHPVSAAPTPTASGVAMSVAATPFPFAPGAFAFGGPQFGHNPFSVGSDPSASGVAISVPSTPFPFAAGAFGFGGPTLPPFPVQQQAHAHGPVGAPLGFGHQLFPAFPAHESSWVAGSGPVAHSEGPSHAKRRRVFNGLDGDA